MRPSPKRLLAAFSATAVLVAAAVVAIAQPALAAADPSFRVVCYPTGIAQNDPIVFPGQAGKSHMHSFYGAKGVDQNTTVDGLLAQPTSQCGSHFDTVDRSAYWIPTLQQNGQAVYNDDGSQQLHVYYRRAGGPNAAPVAQAFPVGLRMIAGDMRATTPQSNVSYACAKADNNGIQRGGTAEFLTCNSDEVLIARLVFPDCWDGVNLDSPDHKSHMAYSSGDARTCPSDHPVKLPQITFEGWYTQTNGPASSFAWSSGGPYSFHGDVMSAWDTRAAANLVNQCINVAVDCNPLMYEAIPTGSVSQSQIDAQLSGTTPSAPAASDPPMDMDHGTMGPTTPPSTSPPATGTPSSSPATSKPVAAPPTPSKPASPPVVVTWRNGDFRSWLSTCGVALYLFFRHWSGAHH